MTNIRSINRFFLYSADRSVTQKISQIYAPSALTQLEHLLGRLSHLLTVVALCLAIVLGFSSTALADAGPSDAATAPTNTAPDVTSAITESANVSTGKIDQFAQAYLQVLQLLGDRKAEISAAETNAEALKIEKSIEVDAIAIITNQGLTPPEYMQILGLASQDATFQDKVLGRMNATQGKL